MCKKPHLVEASQTSYLSLASVLACRMQSPYKAIFSILLIASKITAIKLFVKKQPTLLF
jgi:hypothetical protein